MYGPPMRVLEGSFKRFTASRGFLYRAYEDCIGLYEFEGLGRRVYEIHSAQG